MLFCIPNYPSEGDVEPQLELQEICDFYADL